MLSFLSSYQMAAYILNIGRYTAIKINTIPILGNIARMGGASQFAHTMSMLLAAGMPILQAIETAPGPAAPAVPGRTSGRSRKRR